MTAEVEINPFRPGGELSREVDTILKNSTILRDTIIINDPSLYHGNGNGTNGSLHHTHLTDNSPNDNSKLLNGLNTSLPSGPITCEVTAQHVSPPDESNNFRADQIEHVNIRPHRKSVRCCAVQ